MNTTRHYCTTVCPACERHFQFPYYTSRTLYRMTCPKCKIALTVDITPYLENKVEVLRDGTTQTETLLHLPEALHATVEA